MVKILNLTDKLEMSCEYRVLVRYDQIGHVFRFDEYPNLEFKYLDYGNHLCPSNYSDVQCFWAGYVEVTFEVNGQLIKLRNDQSESQEIVKVNNNTYKIWGCDFLVEDRSYDKTWLYFNIDN